MVLNHRDNFTEADQKQVIYTKKGYKPQRETATSSQPMDAVFHKMVSRRERNINRETIPIKTYCNNSKGTIVPVTKYHAILC